MPYIWEHAAWPDLVYDESACRQDFERIVGKAGELAGLRTGLSADDRLATYVNELSEETVSSFAIEGEALDRRAVRDSLTASLLDRDRKQAAGAYRNVVEVMIDARDTSRPLTAERLNGWHALLFERASWMADVGRPRTGPMQVVSTNRHGEITEVNLRAPPAERVAGELESLVHWIAHTAPGGEDAGRFQTPGRAALAHFRFETIHPYEDGNGRIGRALADHVMTQNPVFVRAPFSLSRVIEAEKEAYYTQLETGQSVPRPTRSGQLDMTPFVGWFAGAMDNAIDQATEMALHITTRNRFFDRFGAEINERQEKALRHLFEQGPARIEEGLSSRRYRRTTGVSRQTASRDLADLVAKGALLPPTQGGRSTAYGVNVAARGAGALSRDEMSARAARYAALAEQMSDPEQRERAFRQIEAMRAADGLTVRVSHDQGRSDIEHEPGD